MSLEKSSMGMYIGIFVVGLVVGVLIGWGIVGTRGAPGTTAMNDASSTSMSGASETTNNRRHR